MKALQRQDVLEIIHEAFYKTVRVDYRYGHCISEEDVRANVYRYMREEIACDDSWRVFLNLTARTNSPDDDQNYKPDLSFFTLANSKTRLAKVEIFVEIKHWPTADKVKRDIDKLFTLRKIYQDDDPLLVFIAIMGTGFDFNRICELEAEIRTPIKDDIHLSILMKRHVYDGPWNDADKFDPWRGRLGHKS